MTSYLYHETLTCEVTFVRRIEAESAGEAVEAGMDGFGQLLGVSIGETVPGVEEHNLLADEPHNIPAHFHWEPDTI